MNCPNCGSNVSDKRSRCERCGEDLSIYKKIFYASNLYYNKGLARAKVRDLSGAITALRYSLQLNKQHTSARNLLGLIYFEMGETVAALSEWVISKHFQPEMNDADEYINKVQSNPTKLDSLNQAIKRYNNALTFAKQNSGDLAIIQLKKVVMLNPHFIRAYHLLAVLYMKNGEFDKAKKSLSKALTIDVSNTTTLRYLKSMEASNPLTKNNVMESDTSVTSSIVPVSSYKEDKPNIIAYVNLVIGVILGVAVTAFLVIPSVKKSYTSEYNRYLNEVNAEKEKQEGNKQTIENLKKENQTLADEVTSLQSQLDSIVIPEVNANQYDPLFSLMQVYLSELSKYESQRDYVGMASNLVQINETELESEASIEVYDSIKDVVYPKATQAHYIKGHEFYGRAKYAEALIEFEKAATYDPTNVDAIYFTARCYHRTGDTENAIVYYTKLVEEHPDSNRTRDAKSFLKTLQS